MPLRRRHLIPCVLHLLIFVARQVTALVRRLAKSVLPSTRVSVQAILHRSGCHIALQGTAEPDGEETWCLLKRVQRQAEQAKKKEDGAKKKKKEEEEKRKKKEKEEEEKRKKKEKEEEERRKKKEKEGEEKRWKKAEEEKAEKVMQRMLSLSLHVLCISSRLLCSVLRVLCLCYASALLFPGKQDGTAAGTPAAARIKASTEAACPSPRPATRTRRSVQFHPTQYGSEGQAAEQSRRGQGGKR